MVTYFNKKDLVEFGKYLLSDKRNDSIALGFKSEHIEGISLKEKQQKVYDSDIENFLHKEKSLVVFSVNSYSYEELKLIQEKIKNSFLI